MTDDRLPDNRHLNRQACPVVASPVGSRLWRQTASFSSLAARKATFLLALILMGSPVAGLRPMRAARWRTCRMPSPPIRRRLPFLRCFTMRPTMSDSIASLCFLGTSWLAAISAARCLRVTVVAVFPDFLAAMAVGLLCQDFEASGSKPQCAARTDTRFGCGLAMLNPLPACCFPCQMGLFGDPAGRRQSPMHHENIVVQAEKKRIYGLFSRARRPQMR